MIPFTFPCFGAGGCPSDIVLRCHAMVTTVELQRRCIHCSHFEAVNHSSVFRRPCRLFIFCPTGCLQGTEGTGQTGSRLKHLMRSFWYTLTIEQGQKTTRNRIGKHIPQETLDEGYKRVFFMICCVFHCAGTGKCLWQISNLTNVFKNLHSGFAGCLKTSNCPVQTEWQMNDPVKSLQMVFAKRGLGETLTAGTVWESILRVVLPCWYNLSQHNQ